MYRNSVAQENEQPLRELLRYHFEQTVICNMKGRGPDYDFDTDIPPGSGVMSILAEAEGGKAVFEMMTAEILAEC